jgi:hypothetical protein
MARRNVPARRGETLPADYPRFLEEVKRAVSTARSQAALAISAAVLAAYWEIGTGIIAREDREGWGAKVIERLAADLRRELPDMRGCQLVTFATCASSREHGRRRAPARCCSKDEDFED